MVLGKLSVPGRGALLICMMVGQGHTAFAGVVWTFFLSSIFSLFFSSLWKTTRSGLKYCL